LKKFKYSQNNYNCGKEAAQQVKAGYGEEDPYQKQVNTMVAFVKISKKGTLVRIKEVSDQYRDQPYRWDEDE
jgi:hypothetical protein